MTSATAQLAQLAAASTPNDDALEVQLWQVFGGIAVVVGLVAAVQQLFNAFKRRRYDKAQDRLLETIGQQIDAEAVRRDLAESKALWVAMRKQVEVEVPREARRVYLQNRAEALQSQLATDLEEYERVSGELARDSSEGTAPELDPRLRLVIEESIRPDYARRQRNERLVVGLLAVLVLFALSPVNLLYLVFGFFEILGEPIGRSDGEVVMASAFGILIAASIAVVVVRSLSAHGVRWAALRAPSLAVAALILASGAGLIVMSAVAYQQGLDVDTDAALERYEAALETNGEAPNQVTERRLTAAQEALDTAYAERNRHYERMGTFLAFGVPIAGIGLGAIVGLLSVRWRLPRRR